MQKREHLTNRKRSEGQHISWRILTNDRQHSLHAIESSELLTVQGVEQLLEECLFVNGSQPERSANLKMTVTKPTPLWYWWTWTELVLLLATLLEDATESMRPNRLTASALVEVAQFACRSLALLLPGEDADKDATIKVNGK